MLKKLISYTPLILILIGVWQFENIYDWWFLRTYNPAAEIVVMADNSTMTMQGRRTFYLTDPQFDEKAQFNQHCPIGELSLVLGCYVRQDFLKDKIYLLKIDRVELAKVMEVTAAHEMLHAAYRDLSAAERRRVDTWINEFYKSVTDDKVRELVAEYDRSEPGERLNELHSILPTQVATLSPPLEDYYKRYFNNRSAVVAAYKSYEAVFENLETQIAALRAQIIAHKTNIENLDVQIKAKRAEIEVINSQLEKLLSQNNIRAYNVLVQQQNALVRDHNTSVTEYKKLVTEHNEKVNLLNQLALEQNQLVDSLDSTQFTPLN